MILICGTKGSTKRVDDNDYMCPVCSGPNSVEVVRTDERYWCVVCLHFCRFRQHSPVLRAHVGTITGIRIMCNEAHLRKKEQQIAVH